MDTLRFVWRALRAQIPMCWQPMGRCASKHNWPRSTSPLVPDLWIAGCCLADGDVRDDRDPWCWICVNATQNLSGWLWHSLIAQCTIAHECTDSCADTIFATNVNNATRAIIHRNWRMPNWKKMKLANNLPQFEDYLGSVWWFLRRAFAEYSRNNRTRYQLFIAKWSLILLIPKLSVITRQLLTSCSYTIFFNLRTVGDIFDN